MALLRCPGPYRFNLASVAPPVSKPRNLVTAHCAFPKSVDILQKLPSLVRIVDVPPQACDTPVALLHTTSQDLSFPAL